MSKSKVPHVERKVLNYFKDRIGDTYKNLEISVCKMVQTDHVEDGCDPDTCQDLGEVAVYRNKDTAEVKKVIDFFTGGRNEQATIYDNRIEISVHENTKGEAPTEEELNDFALGKIKLYCADYTFHLTRVERTSLEHKELKQLFPNYRVE